MPGFPHAALHAAAWPSPHLPCLLLSALQYAGESDLQLERINVYFNEATGGTPVYCLPAQRVAAAGSADGV